ncbi:hypothetical protein [Rhizobium lentis]|uniref:hypothetical protein n=1 Tax=Rhizobium lentis TaxID=1138194 RepID=UPI001FEADF8A|nr:hypothetical protein [Rhizobium lentis]
MVFLLDTNIVSAARGVERQAREFQDFMRSFPSLRPISAVTIMEIQFGIQRERTRDPGFA